MVSPEQEAREAAISWQQQELPALYPEMLPTCYGSTSQHPPTTWDLSDYKLVELVGNFSVNHFFTSKGQSAESEMAPEEADLDMLLRDNVVTWVSSGFWSKMTFLEIIVNLS